MFPLLVSKVRNCLLYSFSKLAYNAEAQFLTDIYAMNQHKEKLIMCIVCIGYLVQRYRIDN